MFITFDCPECKSSLEISAVAVGAEVACPHCQAAITVPSQGLGPGTTIGGFRIERKLGEGGMGEVYLASQLSMDRNVALKILPSQMGLRQDLAERFLNELKLLAKLTHPHIVTAYEAGADSGIHYFAMEYMPGDSLGAQLQGGKVLAEPEALGIARKLAGALAYAWNKHKLLHRDIKPANVILDEAGEPKLVDFGLAKSLAAEKALTVTSQMMGTPNYMSPEQVDGAAAIDAGADMYSLGATLYNMVTGQIPFGSSSVMEVLKKQVTESLADPREFNPELSEGCVALLEIMLSKSREQRHATWEAVIADIDRVLAGQAPTRAAPAEGRSTLIRIRDQALLAELKKKTPRAKRPMAAPAPKAPARRKPGLLLAVGAVVVLGVLIGGLMLAKRKGGPAHGPVAGPAAPAGTGAAPVVAGTAGQAKFQQAYQDALEFMMAHAEDYDGALNRFEAVRQAGAGTEFAGQAADQIKGLLARKQKAIDNAWQDLKAQAEAQAARGEGTAALELLEQYKGGWARETAPWRAKLAAAIREKESAQVKEKEETLRKEAERKAEAEAKAAESKRAAEVKARAMDALNAAAVSLLKGDARQACQVLADAQKQGDPATAGELKNAADLAGQAAGLSEAILAGFERDKGKETQVEFKDGRREKLQLVGTANGQIKVRRQLAAGYVERSFGLADISPEEKIRRLGEAGKPGASL